jgi:hypothetical protein
MEPSSAWVLLIRHDAMRLSVGRETSSCGVESGVIDSGESKANYGPGQSSKHGTP